LSDAYDWKKALFELSQPRKGWVGQFTTVNAPGALVAGTRITKLLEEQGDMTPLGTKGTILGSMHDPEHGVAYFIEWDDKPKCAVAVMGWKVVTAVK
jgi:hypothetical protein